MEFITPIFVLLAVAIIAHIVNKWEEKGPEDSQRRTMLENNIMLENKKEEKMETGKNTLEKPRTRELFLETLTKIGCQYEFGEGEDDRILFAYQGEHFMVDASNERFFVTIWDTYWAHIELYDIDELSRLKKAINGSNISNSVTTVYTIDEAGGNVDVHCKSIILFIPQTPQLEGYLRMELGEFFRVHHYIGNEMTKLREQENAVNR